MEIKKNKINLKKKNNVYSIQFINKNGFKFKFINFGCYISNICIPYKNQKKLFEDVILGYKNFNEVQKDKSFLNCTIGRVAGRIANSSFRLSGKRYNLNNNEKKHHIHGGDSGFNKKVWNIVNLNKNSKSLSCKMVYRSSDLEEGYPGELLCSTIYTLNNNNEIIIKFHATTNKDTIVNLTNHNYWNFNGHSEYYNNIGNHVLFIDADRYCVIDTDFIPTGKIISLSGKKIDFRKPKIIGSDILEKGGIDHYYINKNYNNKLIKVLEVFSPSTKMGLTMWSNQPGLQLYTGNNMEAFYNGKNNLNYGKNYGLCLEPQKYPNSFNAKKFSGIILDRNKIYKSTIKFCLKNDY